MITHSEDVVDEHSQYKCLLTLQLWQLFASALSNAHRTNWRGSSGNPLVLGTLLEISLWNGWITLDAKCGPKVAFIYQDIRIIGGHQRSEKHNIFRTTLRSKHNIQQLKARIFFHSFGIQCKMSASGHFDLQLTSDVFQELLL